MAIGDPLGTVNTTQRMVIAISGVLLFGILFGWWLIARADSDMRDDFLQQTQMLADAIHPDSVCALEGDASDLDRPVFQRLNEQLALAGGAYPLVQRVYLLGERANREVFYFMGSETNNPRQLVAPGHPYPEASLVDRSAFSRQTGVVEGPHTDATGSWVSALVPLRITSAPASQRAAESDARRRIALARSMLRERGERWFSAELADPQSALQRDHLFSVRAAAGPSVAIAPAAADPGGLAALAARSAPEAEVLWREIRLLSSRQPRGSVDYHVNGASGDAIEARSIIFERVGERVICADAQRAASTIKVVLGMDRAASQWVRMRLQAGLPALVVVVLLVGGAVIGAGMSRLRRRSAAQGRWWMSRTEPLAAVVAGLLLTAAIAWVGAERETRDRDRAFWIVAGTRTKTIAEIFSDIRSTDLEGLAHILELTHHWSYEDYLGVTSYLANQSEVQGWAWVPIVPASELAGHEQEANRDGLERYGVWQHDAQGGRVRAANRAFYYPVRNVAPAAGNERALGFDCGSEPARLVALQRALRTGLTSASDPVRLVQESGEQRGIVVFRPVFSAAVRERPIGFAVAELRMGALMESMGGDTSAQLQLGQMLPDRRMQPLAGSPGWAADRSGVTPCVRPVLAFGKVFAVTATAGEGFVSLHPRRAGWLISLAGLMGTLVLAMLGGFWLWERNQLSAVVAARTAELRTSEETYRNQFARNASVMLLIDPSDGSLLDANAAACAFYGYSREQLLRMRASDVNVLPFDSLREVMASVRDDGRSFEFQHRLADGAVRDVEVSSSRIRFGDREIIHSIVRDITQRKLAEARLQENESRMRSVTESAHDAIIMMDGEGRVSFWNPAAERILGYTREEAVGCALRDLILPERYHPQFDLGFAAYLWTGGGAVVGRTVALDALCKGGSEIPVELSLSVLRAGDEWHAVGVLRDVSDRRKAELEQAEHNRELTAATARATELAARAEAASRAKGEFLANMSHEIRTPMNGVIGMSALLLDTDLSAEQRHCAEILRSSGEALLTVLNDILDLSKVEAGKLELDIRDFDLRDVCHELTELLAVRAQEKGLDLVSMADPDVPVLLRGDPGRLRQILLNLAGNAVKFTELGGVTIGVHLMREEEGRALLRFRVTDTGIGIRAEDQANLFDPFTQVDGSTTRRYGGTGLGLSISKQLVELMDGEIGVESEAGAGSTFWFNIELAMQAEPHPADASPPAALAGARVLVVDDFADTGRMLTSRLERWGCRAEAAGDGEAALALLRAAAAAGDPFAVAIIDLQMPGMGGAELCGRIASEPAIRGLYTVILMTEAERVDPMQSAEVGFGAYCTKPIRESQVLECLVHALTGDAGGDPAGPRPATPGARPMNARTMCAGTVLLAEDNATNRLIATKALERQGYVVVSVENGAQALEELRAGRYDVVLMDCQMPVMDGFEATRRIRAGEAGEPRRGIPIIALTARAMVGDRERCLEAGMSDYLSKPLDPRLLVAALERGIVPDEASAPEPIPSGTVAFDRAALLERAMGDEELVAEIIGTFVAETPGQIAALISQLDAGDAAAAARTAHSIKGSSAAMGADRLRDAAQALETLGREGDLAGARAGAAALEARFAEAAAAMRG